MKQRRSHEFSNGCSQVYVAYWLLKFGADALARDCPWGRTAKSYARKLPAEQGLVMQKVLERFTPAASPVPPDLKRFRRLHSTAPPRGFEEFFAKLSEDPLVVDNGEGFWLQVRGSKRPRSMQHLG